MERFVILRQILGKKICHIQTRGKSYKHTLNNPDFPIPMRKVRSIDSTFEDRWNVAYNHQLKNRTKSKSFVLHDGPPYANGSPHVGHALNKILKDVTVRYKILQGFRVDYRPGWDCHGLPIEMKALGLNPSKSRPDMTRNKARAVAEKFIGIQGDAFKKWGVMGNWLNTYRTLDYNYQAAEIRAFYKLYKKGLVTRGLWPVHWSYSSRTALAEAELEYNEEHKSHSIHVAFKTSRLPEELNSKLPTSSNVFLIIWTTTPWTIISNEAVAVHTDINYQLCYSKDKGSYYICSEEFVSKLAGYLESPLEKITQFRGDKLIGCQYEHPLISGKECPICIGDHVTTEKGTGLVHIAPCHGREDFELGQKNGLPLNVAIDEKAVYTEVAGPDLKGLFALTDGSEKILDLLGSRVLHHDHLLHSYPYDWRSKQPVIILASNQWFLDTSQLKDQALTEYDKVEVFPANMKGAMRGFIADRPRWCISRQRVWGVPIPVFFHDGQPVVDEEFISAVADRVGTEGSDFWWSQPLENFLPSSVLTRLRLCPDKLEKSSDIFDIWVDSGLSWLAALGESEGADLYLEGQDQFRGWFSSSLLLSTALTGKSPFKKLAVHGFTTDESGLKMSKSLGNVVSPDQLVSKHGVDVLRYWATSAGLGRSSVGDKLVGHMAEKYRATRNMFRFMLGNLSDFDSSTSSLSLEQLFPTDRYLLHQVGSFLLEVGQYYDNFEYDRILPSFDQLSVVVSNLYFTAVKDRLYCDPPSSRARRSAQTALHITLRSLTLALAPLLPYLAEEVHAATSSSQDQQASSLLLHHEAAWGSSDRREWEGWCHVELAEAVSSVVIPLRGTVTTAPELEVLRLSGTNPAGQLALEVVPSSQELYHQLRLVQSEVTSNSSSLCELLRCASVTLLPPSDRQYVSSPTPVPSSATLSTSEFTLRATLVPSEYHCPRCRRYTITEAGDTLCQRCEHTVSQLSQKVAL